MKPPEVDILAASQLLPLVLNGDEAALWACVRLALRSNWLELLEKATNNWRGFTLSRELHKGVARKKEIIKKPRELEPQERRLIALMSGITRERNENSTNDT